MSMSMQPQQEDYSINIPITFDYRGGRAENKKGKVIAAIILIVLVIIIIVGLMTNVELDIWQRMLYSLAVFYAGLLLGRYVLFNELYFSDIYEGLLSTDFNLETQSIWQIFDIDSDYPYVCYYKNGKKGIFIRMEKDAITGKPDTAMYDHYEAISDAYNMAHALNMDMIHIDYMANIGDDPRLQTKFDELSDVENPDMQVLLIDIYNHLQEEMSRNYASFDIYLFLSRDSKDNFMYNVRNVANTMLGGNFITYKVLNSDEINTVVKALFNIHDFSVLSASEKLIEHEVIGGIIPISVKHADGTITSLNKTQDEMYTEKREADRRRQEEHDEYMRNRHKIRRAKREEKKNKGKNGKNNQQNQGTNDELDLF